MRRPGGRSYLHKVLGLFLAASLLPVVALSLALTGVASSAFRTALAVQGKAATETFAQRLQAILDGMDASLEQISAIPEAQRALYPPASGGDEDAAIVGRILAREAAKGPGLAYALVGADGKRSFSTRKLPRDWEASAFSDWGVLRRATSQEGSAFAARRRVVETGEVALIVAGRALRDPSGTIRAYALAELDRPALVAAARGGGADLAAEIEVRAQGGLVAFSLDDPSREGRYADELGEASQGPGGAFEASEGGNRGFWVRAYLPARLLSGLLGAMRRTTLAGVGACALLALLLALAASRAVTRPVLALAEAMGRLGEGDLEVRLAPAGKDEIGKLVTSFNETAATLAGLMRETVEGQELLRGAELRSLAAQMNPHFLYNSLNSIRSLAKLGRTEEIVEVVTRLGKLLRASAMRRDEVSTFGAGLELVRDYLAVERIRFGERFRFDWDLGPEVLDCELPSLVLEPLAENALTHGLERKRGQGRLLIQAGIQGLPAGACAWAAFEDDGPGASPETLAVLGTSLEAGSLDTEGRSLGLLATNRRLRLRYGEGWGLAVGPGREGHGFRVELRVPARRHPS